jgi:MFS family permease
MNEEKGNESLLDMLERIFSKFNNALESNLKKYQLSELRGYFYALVFLISLSFGIVVSLSMSYIKTDLLVFATNVVVIALLAAIVVFPVLSSFLIHIYVDFHQTKNIKKRRDIIKTTLSWQIITLSFSIILGFVFYSEKFIFAGFAIFFVLLFLYPLLKKVHRKEANIEVDETLEKIYNIISSTLQIIQIILIILKFTNLF